LLFIQIHVTVILKTLLQNLGKLNPTDEYLQGLSFVKKLL